MLARSVTMGLVDGLGVASLRALGTCQGVEGLPSLRGRACLRPVAGAGMAFVLGGTVSQLLPSSAATCRRVLQVGIPLKDA